LFIKIDKIRSGWHVVSASIRKKQEEKMSKTDFDESRIPKKNIIFVTDVDGTLTKKGPSLFGIVDNSTLPPEGVEHMNRIRSVLLTAMKTRPLSEKENMHWIVESLESVVKYRITKKAIVSALKKAQIRDGVRESLKELYEQGVKIAAISFGARQFIEIVFEREGILKYFDAIYAADIEFDKNDVAVNYNPRSIVIPENKGTYSKIFAAKHCFDKDVYNRIIALGDSKGDMHLGHRKDLRLGIAEDHKDAALIAEHFGEVKVDPHFSEVHAWLVKKAAMLR
jgi:HAD superfamily phosphoserine phosphatase-like hydrolase